MNPIEKSKEHLNASAQKMLNLSIALVKGTPENNPIEIEDNLKHAISSVSHISERSGRASERSLSMLRNFQNTIGLMKNKDIDLNKESMLSVFGKSLDDEATSSMEKSLNADNKRFIDQSLQASSAGKNHKSFEGSGLSL